MEQYPIYLDHHIITITHLVTSYLLLFIPNHSWLVLPHCTFLFSIAGPHRHTP